MNTDALRLYLVAGSDGLPEQEFFRRIRAALENGVTMVQLREKEMEGRPLLEKAVKLNRLCARYGVPLLIDDRADIALAAGAAGVHVGQNDLPVAQARQILGPNAIVGATAKTLPQALQAQAEGADYLGVGAIYPTTTKVKTQPTSTDTLKKICGNVDIPAIAIGGLKADNLGILRGTGVVGIAVVSAIMARKNAGEAARELNEAFISGGIGLK